MTSFRTTALVLAKVTLGCCAIAAEPEGQPDHAAPVQNPPVVAAFSALDADAALAAFSKAFYVVENGKGYFKEDSNGERNHFWTQAEEIEMLLDAWDRTQSADVKQQIEESIAGFVDKFGPNWMSNKYNDDLLWMVIATSRAFLMSGKKEYLDLAKRHFDETYARAWSTDLDGGLWWITANNSKNACVNGPGAIAACYLYQVLGDGAYLEKAKAIFAWERSHLFNETYGSVRDNMRANGRATGRPLTYNQGTFIGAANFLYNLTGDKSYLADAEKAADFTRDRLCSDGILPGYGGGDGAGFNSIFIRWLARYARDQHLWPKYRDWMIRNANAAWQGRRADGLAWNRWPMPTPDEVLRAWACTDAVEILQVVPTPPPPAE